MAYTPFSFTIEPPQGTTVAATLRIATSDGTIVRPYTSLHGAVTVTEDEFDVTEPTVYYLSTGGIYWLSLKINDLEVATPGGDPVRFHLGGEGARFVVAAGAEDGRGVDSGAHTFTEPQSVVYSTTTDVGAGGTPNRGFWSKITHLATDGDNAYRINATPIRGAVQFGSSSVDATGTAIAVVAEMDVQGVANNQSEPCSIFVVNRASNPEAARYWLADTGMHGPINVQPSLLAGWTICTNNYYNGSPADGPSHGLLVTTWPNRGPSKDGAGHNTATTYKMDYGIQVTGRCTGGNPGFQAALKIGGRSGAWGDAADFPTVAFYGADIEQYTTAGIYVHNPIVANAPAAIFGEKVIFSNAKKLRGYAADGTTERDLAYVNSSSATVFGDVAVAASVLGTSVTFTTTGSTMLTIGQFSLAVADGKNISVGTTTGSQIGTGATQKLGFFGKTPIVQPSATPAAATDAATTQTLVNDLRTKLINLGLIA